MQRMAALRVLLLDDDAWTFEVARSVLGRRGHTVQQAATLAAARAYLPLLLPDVLLVEPAVAPSAELAAFLRTLPPAVVAAGVGATLSGGEDSPLACDPVVVLLTSLASDDDRLRGLPAEGCLHKPFRFAELDRVVEQALASRRGRSGEYGPAFAESGAAGAMGGVHGSLDQLSLASLLTMIEMERKSGILLLRRGSQSARLYCREGRVLAARLFTATAPTTLSGIDVVYKLLTWTDGRFDFSSVPVRLAGDGAKGRSAFVGGGAVGGSSDPSLGAVDRELDIPITHLLLESARRRDEGQSEPAAHPGA